MSDEIIGKNVLEHRKKWMTQEILDKVRKKNYLRKRNVDKHKQLKNITTECRKAKEQWMEEIN